MENSIQIIEYKNVPKKFSNQLIHEFVDLSMHHFIGRPFKVRNDVMQIEDYYIKNGGNFWIAVDKEKIVGTIALEKRQKKGILKRFYVDENYQHFGVGNDLYCMLEKYVKEETDIQVLYLACGKVLKAAHRFYSKHGFQQTDTLEIDMHVSDDDDYFKKELNSVD